MFILISYDIPDDKRRTRLAKRLRAYGDRVQYSVFECNLTDKQLRQLRAEIGKIIKDAEDSVRIYRLCGGCVAQIVALGQAPPPQDDPVVYIV
jgi:CRISPR-associated protein Cas2